MYQHLARILFALRVALVPLKLRPSLVFSMSLLDPTNRRARLRHCEVVRASLRVSTMRWLQ